VLDFTRSEQRTVVFLLVCFGLGTVIKSFRHFHQSMPALREDNLLSTGETAGRYGIDDQSDEGRVLQPASIPINRASPEQLVPIPGIGPVLAKRIVEYRIRCGGFRSLDELMKVRGIGKKSYDKISPFLVLE